jgi:hypothetical protein
MTRLTGRSARHLTDGILFADFALVTASGFQSMARAAATARIIHWRV